MGTPAFMAPEQARGARVDTRADIYAVGAIGYACITGRSPYDLSDTAAALHAVLTVDPPRPRSLVPEIPEDLELVLQRAMARDPDDRYATLEAFSEALAPFAPATAGQSSAALATFPGEGGERELAGIARRARPEISTFSAVAAIFLVGGFAETFAVGGAGRLAVVAAVAALATPAWLFVRYLRLRVWPSSPQAVVAARLGRTVVSVGAGVFTATYLCGRLIDLSFGEGEGPGAWGRVMPWLIALLAASFASRDAQLRRSTREG
jgi:serine/threonine-protein kinase